jgi:choline transporter-like protein 2/4/5
MAISIAVSLWYFNYHKEEDRKTYTPVKTALIWTSVWHFGSVCFGALILTAVGTLRWILRTIRDNASEDGNFVMSCIAATADFCCGCIEELLNHLTKAAYIMIGITGFSFWEAV